MAEEPTAGQRALAARLRELRSGLLPGRQVIQREVADALGVSVALVSSWESETRPVVPPEERLKSIAHFVATPRSVEDGRARLVEDLTTAEEALRRSLIDELVHLREEALAEPSPVRRDRGALGGRFWHFPDGQPIRIITSKLSRQALTSIGARRPRGTSGDGCEPVPYADPWHPNYVDTLWDGDAPSTLELFGHIRAENPFSEVRFYTADKVTQNHLTGHVVVLGQGDSSFVALGDTAPAGPLTWLMRRHNLPWAARLPAGGDEEFDSEFVVTLDEDGEPTHYSDGRSPGEQVFRPVFLRDGSGASRSRRFVNGYPQLEYDVALLARMPNELNLSATLTICSGIFSRGTYGAVRAFTDANLRTRNEQWLYEHANPADFWMFLQVPVFPGAEGLETVTPDLERPFHRLRMSSRRVAATP